MTERIAGIVKQMVWERRLYNPVEMDGSNAGNRQYREAEKAAEFFGI